MRAMIARCEQQTTDIGFADKAAQFQVVRHAMEGTDRTTESSPWLPVSTCVDIIMVIGELVRGEARFSESR